MSKPRTVHVEAVGRSRRITPTPGQQDLKLSDLLRRHDLPLNTRCGQQGLCDGCMVELIEGGLTRVSDRRCVRATREEHHPVVRGCEYVMAGEGDLFLRIPARSLLTHPPQVLTDFCIRVPSAHAPLFDAAEGRLAAAVDLGTTTVVVALVDLTTGKILQRASSFNRQMHLGDDVLTRINLCSTDVSMIQRLQQAAIGETLNPLLNQVLAKADLPIERLAGIVVAGNTTMLHLLVGVDPSPMGVVPFTTPFLKHRVMSARDIGLLSGGHARHPRHHETPIHLLPSAAAYIGADICAGISASGLAYEQGPSLLIDVGTNGEIVLKHEGKLYGCATAAGPAFEGASLRCGCRAATGAVSHLRLSMKECSVDAEVVGEAAAHGVCGTAYIDLLAEGRRVGLLTPTGRLDFKSAPVFETLKEEYYGGAALRVAKGQGGRAILITETDIASLLQAKAAIAAGILTLLERKGLGAQDVRTVYLAGGFGMHLDIQNAIGSGLLPGFEPHQIELVGNTSLAGAYLASVDRGILDELQRIAGRVRVIELNLDRGFESRFIDQLMLP